MIVVEFTDGFPTDSRPASSQSLFDDPPVPVIEGSRLESKPLFESVRTDESNPDFSRGLTAAHWNEHPS
ncbi:hypothetical protein [Halobaculum sp. EA56]|uniref:hypothetical protein n=1 Tax=Halobaculum sp. EA56 TaxID=3421648 RepID=UPI003EBD27F7